MGYVDSVSIAVVWFGDWVNDSSAFGLCPDSEATDGCDDNRAGFILDEAANGKFGI
jgi:hypothetical protein